MQFYLHCWSHENLRNPLENPLRDWIRFLHLHLVVLVDEAAEAAVAAGVDAPVKVSLSTLIKFINC